MVEPISPSDVKKFIPDFIIETVNKLIMKIITEEEYNKIKELYKTFNEQLKNLDI